MSNNQVSYYDNPNYRVIVVPYKKNDADESVINCYGVQNIQSGVIEQWDFVLANAIVLADNVNKALEDTLRERTPNPTININ